MVGHPEVVVVLVRAVVGHPEASGIWFSCAEIVIQYLSQDRQPKFLLMVE